MPTARPAPTAKPRAENLPSADTKNKLGTSLGTRSETRLPVQAPTTHNDPG
jgi:hypothetical protein